MKVTRADETQTGLKETAVAYRAQQPFPALHDSTKPIHRAADRLERELRSMLHRKTNDRNPADWFAFAEERLRGADVLWKSEGITALGIEALQEAMERYLKGFLIANGWTLIMTRCGNRRDN